ncbi:hypothetical protein CspeluHIS016_0211690 [Cutaneotrichosporon spelunceum]|uniref:Plasma membrane fusion protein PRM1 n=1 Tax=Cutaneotrichosporon spelunceum TaxID=1672016 RepID=A0AAD3TSI8_9TREE|nr:hypothetical protein CspeluHIS016_0211690 [Cutaneotrichosporon spelunceum]
MSPHVSQTDDNDERDELKPFLGLGPRLWLTAFNPGFLPLIFTIASVAATRKSTNELAVQLKSSVLDACDQIAAGAGTLQALPRYLAMQTNAEALRTSRATVLAVGKALMDCITVIEVVLNFIVDTYRSLLLCTIQLVVQGSLELLIGTVQTISDGVTNSLNSIRSSIQDDIGKMNNIIQSAVNGINRVTSIVNVDLSVPSIDIPSLNLLSNVTISTGFEDSLLRLNGSLPSLGELRDKMNTLINTPFEALKAEINETRLEIANRLNASTFPVPALQTLRQGSGLRGELCGDLDTGFIDDTAAALHKLGGIAIGLMVLALLLGWGALAFYQWQRWRALKETVAAVEGEWRREAPNAWTTVAVVDAPLIERYAVPLMNKAGVKPRTRNNIRWLLSYLSQPTCLTLLIMSVVGLIAIQAQIAALHSLKAAAQARATESIGATTTGLSARLNGLLGNASSSYAEDMNTALTKIETSINQDLFGYWVSGTAANLNATLVEFYDDVERLIKTAFDGTPLYRPINGFVYCILGSKIDSLEKALTWVRAHAHIDLPTIPSDVLQLSPESTAELAGPVTAAAVGEEDPDSGAVGKLVKHFEDALRAQQVVYGILLGVYGVVLLVGLLVVIRYSGSGDSVVRWRATRADDDKPRPSGSDTLHPLYQAYSSRERSHQAEPVPPTEGYYSGSLRALAAPGAAFLGMRGYVPSPAPGDTPTHVPNHKTHPWKELSSSDDLYDGEGFWVTRAAHGHRDQSPALPESEIGSRHATRATTPEKAAAPLSPSQRPSTPSRESSPSPLPYAYPPSVKVTPRRQVPVPLPAESPSSVQLTPPRMKKLPIPAWKKRDEVDALGDSAASTPECTTSGSRTPSFTRTTPHTSPGRLGGLLQELREQRRLREAELRIDPYYNPKQRDEEVAEEAGRAL